MQDEFLPEVSIEEVSIEEVSIEKVLRPNPPPRKPVLNVVKCSAPPLTREGLGGEAGWR